MWFRVKNRQNRLGSSLREGLGWCLSRISTISHAFEDWSTSICRDHLKLKFLKNVQIATGCLDFVQLFASARFKDFKRIINSFTFFEDATYIWGKRLWLQRGSFLKCEKRNKTCFFSEKISHPPWKLNKKQPWKGAAQEASLQHQKAKETIQVEMVGWPPGPVNSGQMKGFGWNPLVIRVVILVETVIGKGRIPDV